MRNPVIINQQAHMREWTGKKTAFRFTLLRIFYIENSKKVLTLPKKRATKFIVVFAAKQLLSGIFHCPLPCSNPSLQNMKGNSHLQELLWPGMLRQGWIRSKSPKARTKGQGMLSVITKALQQLLQSSLQNPHESQMLAFHPVVLC